MQFNISRQPLIPAFITLAALTVAAVIGMDTQPDIAQEVATAAGQITAGATDNLGATAPQSLAIDLPHTLLIQFQTTYPIWSKLLVGILLLFTGMCTGRMTVRCNLYSVNTCLAIPLYAIVACGLPWGSSYLVAFTASALLALAIKNYAASFCNGYSFDAIFRASFYLGVLILVLPAALPLLLLLPLAVLLFRRTVREAVVAVTGALLPSGIFCYINWGAGGDFTAPLITLGSALVAGTPLGLFYQLSAPIVTLLLSLILLALFAVMLFVSDRYNVGTKARLVIIFNIGILFLSILLLCGPAATAGLFPLLSVPLAVLLPLLFVRINHAIALPLYLVLLLVGFCATILQ